MKPTLNFSRGICRIFELPLSLSAFCCSHLGHFTACQHLPKEWEGNHINGETESVLWDFINVLEFFGNDKQNLGIRHQLHLSMLSYVKSLHFFRRQWQNCSILPIETHIHLFFKKKRNKVKLSHETQHNRPRCKSETETAVARSLSCTLSFCPTSSALYSESSTKSSIDFTLRLKNLGSREVDFLKPQGNLTTTLHTE